MINILLVDDETYVTESLVATIPWNLLSIEGVYQAASADEAMRILSNKKIDIVVTDIRMPEKSGLTLIAEAEIKWPRIKYVLLTGYADFSYAQEAIRLQVIGYLLKPINDDEFMEVTRNAVKALLDECNASEKYNRLAYNRRSDYSVLRTNLMNELLLGSSHTSQTIARLLTNYEIPLSSKESVVMLLVQRSVGMGHNDPFSVQLVEYAIGNIAEEIFGKSFRVWYGKAPHDCLFLLVSSKLDSTLDRALASYEKDEESKLRDCIVAFKQNVGRYLKETISICVTDKFIFPEDLPSAYRSGLNTLQLNWDQDRDRNVIYIKDTLVEGDYHSGAIERLHRHPTLIHLLEMRQWQAAEKKMDEVFEELKSKHYTRRHLFEVYLSISNAFINTSNKSGQKPYKINQSGPDPYLDPGMVYSLEKLKSWFLNLLDRFCMENSLDDRESKSSLVKKVQEAVAELPASEISVKFLADKLFVHPVYLAKIYKSDTGEGLGEYIIRKRMERARYLLRFTTKKIYEITTDLGYQNPQHFSKVFKKFYGRTPNEFRN